ncbi:hypothetical protein [Marinobacterium sp. BA1]
MRPNRFFTNLDTSASIQWLTDSAENIAVKPIIEEYNDNQQVRV